MINRQEVIPMSVEEKKLELIEWILKLKNASAIDEIIKMKQAHSNVHRGKRSFGSGKHIFIHVTDDFNAPLSEFREYMK